MSKKNESGTYISDFIEKWDRATSSFHRNMRDIATTYTLMNINSRINQIKREEAREQKEADRQYKEYIVERERRDRHDNIKEKATSKYSFSMKEIDDEF